MLQIVLTGIHPVETSSLAEVGGEHIMCYQAASSQAREKGSHESNSKVDRLKGNL